MPACVRRASRPQAYRRRCRQRPAASARSRAGCWRESFARLAKSGSSRRAPPRLRPVAGGRGRLPGLALRATASHQPQPTPSIRSSAPRPEASAQSAHACGPQLRTAPPQSMSRARASHQLPAAPCHASCSQPRHPRPRVLRTVRSQSLTHSLRLRSVGKALSPRRKWGRKCLSNEMEKLLLHPLAFIILS